VRIIKDADNDNESNNDDDKIGDRDRTEKGEMVEEECGPGEAGELRVRGRTMFREYLNRPDLTAECFDSEGWFKTGDVAIYEYEEDEDEGEKEEGEERERSGKGKGKGSGKLQSPLPRPRFVVALIFRLSSFVSLSLSLSLSLCVCVCVCLSVSISTPCLFSFFTREYLLTTLHLFSSYHRK